MLNRPPSRLSGYIEKTVLLLAAALLMLMLALVYHSPLMTKTEIKLLGGSYQITKPFQIPAHRTDIGLILEADNMKVGVELGVQAGVFSEAILANWKSCQKYYLVDIWTQQDNYIDLANVDNDMQEKFYEEAKQRLKPWEQKTVFLRNFTSQAVKYIHAGELDFVYVDARHDYCGCKEDIDLYWPLLKPGGIMAGHDFRYASEVEGQNWSICGDGTKTDLAVRGAVEEFAKKHNLQIAVTYKDEWQSWVIRKPEMQQLPHAIVHGG